ncbi:MAG TPA: thioredoxin-dependent thiol peroxidase [Pseudomonadales bacterium]|nr:thioredoxin-dependent thiol peroxidase [Pseudomonadales bacterium]
MAFPKIGNLAPAFSLPNQDGKTVSLKDFKGKRVILYFYPKAMTPGCTVQACGLRDSARQLARLNAVVLGVSRDLPKALLKFRERDNLDFELLSDPDHVVCEKYGVWEMKKFMGRESMGILRTTFIIGVDGKLRHIMDKVATKTHHDDVIALLQGELKSV